MAAAFLVFSVFISLYISSSFASRADPFRLHPQPQSVLVGGDATFTCQTSYSVNCPYDRIKWGKRSEGREDGSEISTCSDLRNQAYVEKYSVCLENGGDSTTYTLVIHDITEGDRKEYYCYAFRIAVGSGYDISRSALLTVTDRPVCPKLSIRVDQSRDLVVGDEGEFVCDIDTHPAASTFEWVVMDAENQTVSIATAGRRATSSNRLIISPLAASDNENQIRCMVAFSTSCEQMSSWYKLVLVPAATTEQETLRSTREVSGTTVATSTAAATTEQETLRSTRKVSGTTEATSTAAAAITEQRTLRSTRKVSGTTVATSTKYVTSEQSLGQWTIIGSILAIAILQVIIISIVMYLLKNRNTSTSGQQGSVDVSTRRSASSVGSLQSLETGARQTEQDKFHIYTEIPLNGMQRCHQAEQVPEAKPVYDRRLSQHESRDEPRDGPNVAPPSNAGGEEATYLTPNTGYVSMKSIKPVSCQKAVQCQN